MARTSGIHAYPLAIYLECPHCDWHGLVEADADPEQGYLFWDCENANCLEPNIAVLEDQ